MSSANRRRKKARDLRWRVANPGRPDLRLWASSMSPGLQVEQPVLRPQQVPRTFVMRKRGGR